MQYNVTIFRNQCQNSTWNKSCNLWHATPLGCYMIQMPLTSSHGVEYYWYLQNKVAITFHSIDPLGLSKPWITCLFPPSRLAMTIIKLTHPIASVFYLSIFPVWFVYFEIFLRPSLGHKINYPAMGVIYFKFRKSVLDTRQLFEWNTGTPWFAAAHVVCKIMRWK